jgi:hypothetical protein
MHRKRPHNSVQKKARQAKFAKRRGETKIKLGIPPKLVKGVIES